MIAHGHKKVRENICLHTICIKEMVGWLVYIKIDVSTIVKIVNMPQILKNQVFDIYVLKWMLPDIRTGCSIM